MSSAPIAELERILNEKLVAKTAAEGDIHLSLAPPFAPFNGDVYEGEDVAEGFDERAILAFLNRDAAKITSYGFEESPVRMRVGYVVDVPGNHVTGQMFVYGVKRAFPLAELADAITQSLRSTGASQRPIALEEMNIGRADLSVPDVAFALREKGDVAVYTSEFYRHVASAIMTREVTSLGDSIHNGVRAFWVKAGDDVYVFPGVGRKDAVPEKIR